MNRNRQPTSPEIWAYRQSLALFMGALAFLGVAERQPVAHVFSDVRGAISRTANHSLTGRNGDLPPLDTDFVVRGPQDNPDNIAAHSGVQDSQDREDFVKKILAEAHQQGQLELVRGMHVEVPKAYAEYADNQGKQE